MPSDHMIGFDERVDDVDAKCTCSARATDTDAQCTDVRPVGARYVIASDGPGPRRVYLAHIVPILAWISDAPRAKWFHTRADAEEFQLLLARANPHTIGSCCVVPLDPVVHDWTPTREQASREYDDLGHQLATDELRAMVLLGRRLLAGQHHYGPLNVATDPRNWAKERREELQDALIYSAFEELQERGR